MPRITPDGHIYFKVVFWGPKNSGKTTTLKGLYQLTTKGKTDIFPVTQLSRIDRNGQSTIFFDHGIFQIGRFNDEKKGIFMQVFTVAGSERFKLIRKILLRNMDGLVFVFDGKSGELEKNRKSIQELAELLKDEKIRIGKDVLFFVQINYPDKNVFAKVDLNKVKSIFIQENLVQGNFSEYVKGVFETVAIQQINVYDMFKTIVDNLVSRYIVKKSVV